MPPDGGLAGLAATLGLADLAGRVAGDPLLAYALLAAAVLAIASLAGGLARGDARALARPAPWAAAALAALAGLALAAAGERIEAAMPGAWPLTGLRRLPLYLVAIGYGPLTGVVAALLFAATERSLGPLPASEAVLVLEMAVVGWLALAPSPRRARWAASFAVALGWAMATATAGLAALAWLHRPLPTEVVLDAWRHDLPGVAATVALLLTASPRWWRRAAPGAAVAPGDGADEAAGTGSLDAGERVLPPLRRARARREPARLAAPRSPRELRRTRRGGHRMTPPALPRSPMEAAVEPALPGGMEPTMEVTTATPPETPPAAAGPDASASGRGPRRRESGAGEE